MKASDFMSNIFNMDNPFFRTLGRLADLMILNICFIICCIPVFTIGAALTGMSYVLLKIAEKEEGYIFKAYWKSFRQNFRQATVIWLISLVLAVIVALDFVILSNASGSFYSVMRMLVLAAVLIYVMILMYVFPLLARFENPIKATIKNALILSIANFPKTLVMLATIVAAVVATLWNYYTIIWGLLIWLLCGFALVGYVHCYFLAKIFAKLVPAREEDKDPDNWVLEETEESPDDTESSTMIQ